MINEKQPKDEEYFSYLGSMITNDERYAKEIKFLDCHGNSSIQQQGTFHQQIWFKFKEETSKTLHLEHSLVRC